MLQFIRFFSTAVLFLSLGIAQATNTDKWSHDIDPNAPWAYDAGPDIRTDMGRELVDLVAAYPFMPEVSKRILGSQKFRIHFGPTFWRMRHPQNSSKILFIGQDATHIAEAAKRTATAGFGGRAQDLAAYFGVDESAAFMNAYQNTIRGQYGTFNTPYILEDRDGRPSVRFGGYVDPKLWLMTQDPLSPLVQWRHKYLDWFLRNNRELKLIVLFGGTARDAMGTFIESLGGKVGTYFDEEAMERIQVPEIEEQYAGANNTYPAVLNRTGGDLAAQLLGREIDYKNLEDQKAVQEVLRSRVGDFLKEAAFSGAGPYRNGLYHPAQLGGFDLDEISIAGVKTISLKGLKLSDGTEVGDVLVAQFPHPSALSRMTKEQASETMEKRLRALRPYVEAGWEIPADTGMVNKFAEGEPYVYSRSQIGPEYYDFGTPGTRMLAVSLASRMPRRADVIVFGTRDRVRFDMSAIDAAATAQPAEEINPAEIFATQPRTPEARGSFDPGPGQHYARLMKLNLDLKALFKLKSGKTWKADGIAAYNVKSHPDLADFGHYRGTFKDPAVIVVADPHGWDDLNTARALTGSRGQHLQGMLKAMGVPENHLILKTVPFGMEGATSAEWKTVLEETRTYREEILRSLLADGKPRLIITDGENASAEVSRILADTDVPVVAVKRSGELADSGLKEAFAEIKTLRGFKSSSWNGEMANIPRSHLPYGSRVWEGTSGDRVFNAADKNKGLAFAIVVPEWAWKQSVKLSARTGKACSNMLDQLKYGGFPMPYESMGKFFKRKSDGGEEFKKAAGQ